MLFRGSFSTQYKKKTILSHFRFAYLLYEGKSNIEMEHKVPIILFTLWFIILPGTNAKYYLHPNKVRQIRLISIKHLLINKPVQYLADVQSKVKIFNGL